jgi:hypothetical protein
MELRKYYSRLGNKIIIKNEGNIIFEEMYLRDKKIK